MQKKKKIIITAISGLIITILISTVLLLPYAFVWNAFSQTDRQKELTLLENAYNLSILPSQKQFILEAIIADTVITKNYYAAILCIEELEKVTTPSEQIKYLAAFSYMQLKDYEKAIKYAKSAGNIKLEQRILEKKKEAEEKK